MKSTDRIARILQHFLLAVILCGSAVGNSHAQPSSAYSISFQGALTGAGGQPLPNGNYDLTFKFYTSTTTLTALATSNVPNVPVTGGIASTPIPVDAAWFNGPTRYLGIGINGGIELAPRVLVTAVPYAAHAIVSAGLALEDADPPAAALRGPDRTWLFGYNGTSGFEDIVIGSLNGIDSARTLTLAAGGHSRIRVADNGFVGIGSLRPDSLLHLHGDDVELRLTCPQDRPSGALRGNSGTWLFGYVGVPGREDISIGSSEGVSTERSVTINAGGFPRIKIEAGGHIGIGTLNPMAALDVNGTARMTVCQITSDRGAKARFASVNGRDVLAKLAAVPISTWVYTNAPGVRHIGPVAQDFAAAFAVGENDKHIATVDADGVALAAIQGLHQLMQEKDGEIRELKQRLEALERKLESRLVAQEHP